MKQGNPIVKFLPNALVQQRQSRLYPKEIPLRPFIVHQAPIQLCIVFTGIILLAIIAAAPPSQNIDDLGLYNPIHVWLTTGHWAYPFYGQFEGMSVHPPFRYMEIAVLMWAGVPQSIALAIMPAFFTTLAIGLLYASDWEPEIKVAICLAMISSWLVMFYVGQSIRPDVEMTIIWIAGLLALEYARQRGWPFYPTAVAGAVITYASVMHYTGTLGLLGAAFYLIPIWRNAGFRKMLPTAVTIIGGAACVLVPYVALYIIPNWQYYKFVFDVGYPSLADGLSLSWKNHFHEYTGLAHAVLATDQFSSSIITVPAKAGIPPFIIGAIGFAMWPRIGLFGLAALPMVLFVLVQSRKNFYVYLYPEYFVTILGITLLLIAAVRLFVITLERFVDCRIPKVPLMATLFLLCFFYVFHPARIFSAAMTEIRAPKIMEEDIARAAAKRAIGEGKLVGGRNNWYVSGATRWYDISQDEDVLGDDNTRTDLASYLKRFDYIVEDAHMSDERLPSISTWYGDGLLSLRGFYLGSNYVISYVRLSATPGPIIGDVYSSGVLSEFREEANGRAMLVTAFCQAGRPELDSLKSKFAMDRILLPKGREVKVDGVGAGQQELVLTFSKKGDELLNLVGKLRGCGVKQIVRGSARDLDLATVLPLAKYDRNVMDFVRRRSLR